jgi:hypothetical protein
MKIQSPPEHIALGSSSSTPDLMGSGVWPRGNHALWKSLPFLKQTLRETVTIVRVAQFPWQYSKSKLVSTLMGTQNCLPVSQGDLYLIHWRWRLVPLKTSMKGLADQIGSRLSRLVRGLNDDLVAHLSQKKPPITIQLPVHPWANRVTHR